MTTVNLKMTTDQLGQTDSGEIIPLGTEVEYVCHVPGPSVRVRLADGREVVLNTLCFPTLRDR